MPAADRVVLDVRPWPAAWVKWPVLGVVIGLLTMADDPAGFAAVMGGALLLALWVGTFRVRIVVDADGSGRLRTRTRSIDLGALRSVGQAPGLGFPQLVLKAGRRVNLGGFGRWGPGRWNQLLNELDPFVRRCDDVHPGARKLWRGLRR
jgi:hypothetical protein